MLFDRLQIAVNYSYISVVAALVPLEFGWSLGVHPFPTPKLALFVLFPFVTLLWSAWAFSQRWSADETSVMVSSLFGRKLVRLSDVEQIESRMISKQVHLHYAKTSSRRHRLIGGSEIIHSLVSQRKQPVVNRCNLSLVYSAFGLIVVFAIAAWR
jgi:hypothetical protein